jgi:hypothetical protein
MVSSELLIRKAGYPPIPQEFGGRKQRLANRSAADGQQTVVRNKLCNSDSTANPTSESRLNLDPSEIPASFPKTKRIDKAE